MAQRKENIVMFPFMAQGHIIPFMALALKLEQEKGYQINFINTPLNIKKLQSSLPPHSSIRLLEIPFNSSAYGLPPNTESTETLPPLLILRLLESSRSLKPAFRRLISILVDEQCGQPPLCVISDMFFGWSAEVAHEFGVFHAIFNAGGGYGMAVYHSTWLNLPHTKATSSGEISLPGFPENRRFHVTELADELRAHSEPWLFGQNMLKEWGDSDGMLLNTIEELDYIGLTYFRGQFRCPIWPVGPILPIARNNSSDEKEVNVMSSICMTWLNTKPKGSVVYVAFGSQHVPSVSQTKQLAKALEDSCKNFIWVVRPTTSSQTASKSLDEMEWLPKGFEERIRESKRGLIVKEWAPQKEILSHESIGAFLSHCGWNSVLEALSNGVPMISWSIAGDQPYNAKMLVEEIGVCVGVANGCQCEVTSGEIVEKIELVMNGMNMKRKAREVKEIIENASKNVEGFKGSSVKAMDEFLDAAMVMRTKLHRDAGQNNVSFS